MVKYRFIGIFFSVAVFCLVSVFLTTPAFAFSGSGSGTSGSPYIITTCLQLQEMSNATSAHYTLGNDIDCSATSTWNSGAGFNPAGVFTGSLDGTGHTISSLFINRPSSTTAGLVGQLDGTISNIALVSTNITGGNYAGGVAGYLDAGSISKSSVDGTVSAAGQGDDFSYAGGVVAFTRGGTISDTYSKALISSTATDSPTSVYAGGLVGFNQVAIQNSYASGNVSAQGDEAYSGGFAGNNSGTVTNVFAIGTASRTSGSGAVGGLIGIQSGTVTNSYSVQSPAVGSGSSTGTTGGKSLSDFYQTSPLLAVYTTTPAWDFDNTWAFNDTSSLPVFTWQVTPSPTPNSSSGSSSAGGGSPSAPSCGEAAPTNAPNLFQIKSGPDNATLYFVPVSGSNTSYYISYGVDSSAQGFGTEFDYTDRSGVIPYTINDLFPGTWYFKVRGQNGCMPGNWSGVVSVKVSAVGSNKVLGAATQSSIISCTNYTVQSGDSLWGIASSHLGNGNQFDTIMQKNSLSSSFIHTGQVLKVGC